ncbi:HAD-IA family hydrolase [Desulfococcaceae bacterium HSG8]|nr:HAD-IA family hydrolase [Desulfococcaceae bacterium HSG8]
MTKHQTPNTKHQTPFCIKAVLFDFDGTLTKPDALDLSVVRQAVGCPEDVPVLEFIENIQSKARKEAARIELEHFELEAAENSEPNPGAEALISYLRAKGLCIGIVTRNTLKSVNRALENFETTGPSDFDLIISRDDAVEPKPSPDCILMAARKLGVNAKDILMAGDFIFDIRAGRNAGAITVFLDNASETGDPKPGNLNWKLETRDDSIAESDYTISHLDELREIIRLGTPLPAGKFPNELLKGVLEQFAFDDPSVLINPGIGEDIAAVNVDNEEVLVLKSDPITFATDSIGHYAVLINANDIATSGAIPRWFLTTLLFPCGTSASEIFHVMHNLKDVCRKWGITLCGGHTEITDAVTRPVVTGMLAGTVPRADLIDKRNMRPGDNVLLTKGVAVEGTSIIAREFGDRLKELGMAEADIETCRNFLSHISVLREAKIAALSSGTSAMHDVTEGGVATALEELSIAGGHRIRIRTEDIPVFPQTEAVCRLFDIHPLGLIGSGSLLICCRQDTCENLIRDIREAGTDVSVIGEVLEEGQGIEALRQGESVEWPCFEVDEITRLF